MLENILVSFVILALVLSAIAPLFVPWRTFIVAAACHIGILIISYALASWELDRTHAEGPTFLGLVVFFIGIIGIFSISCILKLAIVFLPRLMRGIKYHGN